MYSCFGGRRGLVGRVLICTTHAVTGQVHPPPTESIDDILRSILSVPKVGVDREGGA